MGIMLRTMAVGTKPPWSTSAIDSAPQLSLRSSSAPAGPSSCTAPADSINTQQRGNVANTSLALWMCARRACGARIATSAAAQGRAQGARAVAQSEPVGRGRRAVLVSPHAVARWMEAASCGMHSPMRAQSRCSGRRRPHRRAPRRTPHGCCYWHCSATMSGIRFPGSFGECF